MGLRAVGLTGSAATTYEETVTVPPAIGINRLRNEATRNWC